MRVALALLSMLFVWLVAAPARAQQTTFYLDRLKVGGAPDDPIGMWRPYHGEETRFYGQYALGFSLNPFRIEHHIDDPADAARLSAVSGAPVKTQLIGYGAAGVEIIERFALQLAFPVTFLQTGNLTGDASAASARDNVDLTAAALMDLRLDARAQLFETADEALSLGARAAVWLPTGNELSWAGDKSASAELAAAVEYDFDLLFAVFDTGIHFRPTGGVNDFRVGDEWTWALGAFVPLREDSIRLGAQIFGSTGLRDGTVFSAANTPLEWMVEGRLYVDDDRRGFVGAGAGTRMTPGYAPDFRVLAVAGYSFTIHDTLPIAPPRQYDWEDEGEPLADRDGDGIPDISDKCPDQAEDFDGILDHDGCPEEDADKDGIPDAEDACPREPGEASEDPKKNGCPQFIRRITGSSDIEILKQVQFAFGSAVILPESYPILDEVYRLLEANPEITLLSIEGHTDSVGSDEINDRLSADRARSCLQYLVQKGIAPERLQSEGFGERRPIADNDTAEGRARNRRVEFHIRGETDPAAAPPAEQP
jgi:OmpA-OmpF porin, OOP family